MMWRKPLMRSRYGRQPLASDKGLEGKTVNDTQIVWYRWRTRTGREYADYAGLRDAARLCSRSGSCFDGSVWREADGSDRQGYAHFGLHVGSCAGGWVFGGGRRCDA